MKRIGIVDFTVGNIGSIFNAFSFIGCDPILVKDKKDLEKSDLIVLPGVGSFKSGMEGLKYLNIIPELENQIFIRKKSVLGICLGMQLLFKSSEENEDIKGLGWIDGKIKKLDSINNNLPIPHIGWNDIVIKKTSKIFDGLAEHRDFYFVNSFHCNINDKNLVIAETEYEEVFCSAFEKENIIGVQFHPEKSQKNGRILLKNFLSS